MNYFRCERCELTYIHGGATLPFLCGAFVGFTGQKSVPVGCGGKLIKISAKQADEEIEARR